MEILAHKKLPFLHRTTLDGYQGTCYTKDECSSKGGNPTGGCAAGFGVCCVFVISKSGESFKENGTYIRNPKYPSPFLEAGSFAYSIKTVQNGKNLNQTWCKSLFLNLLVNLKSYLKY